MQALRTRVLVVSLGLLALVAAQQPASTGQPPSGPLPPAPAGKLLGQPIVQLDASALLGTTVRNTEGRDIGRVSRLMIDPKDGRITTVVIGIGGFFGIGEKLVSVPWGSVRIGQDGGRVVVVTDQALLDQAPKGDGSASPPTAPGPR